LKKGKRDFNINYKMKLFRISLLVFSVVLFSSCVGEWMERDCQGDFTLYFEYHNMGNNNPVATFLTNVHTVDVFVYNEAGSLVYHRPSIGQAAMQSSRGGTRSTRPGIDLPIGPGANELSPGNRYRVVAWGNVDRGAGRNSFDNQNQVNSARILTATDFGTPLHFGPGTLREANSSEFWITINDTQNDEYAVMQFSRAHVEIQVFVVGASEPPTVDLDNIAAGIDFNKVVNPNTIQFRRQVQEWLPTPEPITRQAQFVNFFVPLFEENTNKVLEISNSSGPLLNGSIRIEDILRANLPHNINQNYSTSPRDLANTNVAVERVRIVLDVTEDPATGYDKIVNVWIEGWINEHHNPGGLL